MSFAYETCETAWCPGCGNFVILECLKAALERLDKKPHEVLLAAGIGQAAKTPQYLSANAFCGLHGRALPAAISAKIANDGLTVVVDSGDGDSYGEGGNHFLHNIRRNVDIAHFVHDNQVYGLTKGQASPTSDLGFITGVQTGGSINQPMNPVLMAIAAGAGFVARGFTGRKEQLIDLMVQAICFKGYALVDILQPCVSFNKVNTFMWYNQRVYDPADYDKSDRAEAMKRAMEFGDKIPLGVLYRAEKPTYKDRNPALNGPPLAGREPDLALVDRLIQSHF
jgi:2-oxoglutarate ferredoxin oxidoreductase subunit beta